VMEAECSAWLSASSEGARVVRFERVADVHGQTRSPVDCTFVSASSA
jgi:hypothetical protein